MLILSDRRYHSLRSLLRDDGGSAFAEFALVLAAFAVFGYASMTLISNEASNQLLGTQTRLTNTSSLLVVPN